MDKLERAEKLFQDKHFKRRKFQTHKKKRGLIAEKSFNSKQLAKSEGVPNLNIKEYRYREDGNIRSAGMYSGVQRAKQNWLRFLIDEAFNN